MQQQRPVRLHAFIIGRSGAAQHIGIVEFDALMSTGVHNGHNPVTAFMQGHDSFAFLLAEFDTRQTCRVPHQYQRHGQPTRRERRWQPVARESEASGPRQDHRNTCGRHRAPQPQPTRASERRKQSTGNRARGREEADWARKQFRLVTSAATAIATILELAIRGAHSC
jgi:hypothetical protein